MSNNLNEKVKEHFENNCDKLLWYLTKNKRKGITTVEAMMLPELSMTNLPRRILDLKERGYEFIDVWEHKDEDPNIRWKRYFLLKYPKGEQNEKHHRNNRPTEKSA